MQYLDEWQKLAELLSPLQSLSRHSRVSANSSLPCWATATLTAELRSKPLRRHWLDDKNKRKQLETQISGSAGSVTEKRKENKTEKQQENKSVKVLVNRAGFNSQAIVGDEWNAIFCKYFSNDLRGNLTIGIRGPSLRSTAAFEPVPPSEWLRPSPHWQPHLDAIRRKWHACSQQIPSS